MKKLTLVMTLLTLASCGSDGDGGNGKITGEFSDSAVTNFQQTSGIAKASHGEKIISLIIAEAYAETGSISCLSGEAISFNMDALGNNVDINSTCSNMSNIEKDIRVNLLKSMTGTKMRRTVTEASYNGDDATLDFSGSFQFDVGYDLPRNAGLPCKETYTFKNDGKVLISATDQSGQTAISDGSPCGGAYDDEIAFQFANGYLEFDISSERNFTATHTTDDEGDQVGAYERFEVCDGSNTISEDTLPTSVGDDNTNLSSVRDAVATTGNLVTCN